MIGVAMPEHTPGGHALAGGVFLTEGLAIIVNSSPVVHASDLCLRPGQGRTDRQGSGAAADLQETALTVIVQMRENDPVNLFHDPAAAKGILTPDPCDPDQQGCQRRRNNREQNTENRDVEHRKGEYGQNHGQSRDTADNIEHGIGHPASVVFAVTAETNFCLLITLLLHFIFLLLFNIRVQFVYGCFSFAFRQTKDAML